MYINILSIYVNNFCDAGQVPILRYFKAWLSKDINPSLVLVQPRKTRPFITERLLMGHR